MRLVFVTVNTKKKKMKGIINGEMSKQARLKARTPGMLLKSRHRLWHSNFGNYQRFSKEYKLLLLFIFFFHFLTSTDGLTRISV